jgi:hypothetical protein
MGLLLVQLGTRHIKEPGEVSDMIRRFSLNGIAEAVGEERPHAIFQGTGATITRGAPQGDGAPEASGFPVLALLCPSVS